MNAALFRRNRGNDRFLKRSGRGNNTLGFNDALRGLDGKTRASAVAHCAFDFNAGTHRQIEGPDVIFKVCRDIVFRNETVGIAPLNSIPGNGRATPDHSPPASPNGRFARPRRCGFLDNQM
jgi:hypothetical protein